MATEKVKFVVTPSLRELQRQLVAFGDEFKDFSPAWRVIGPRLRDGIGTNFATQGSSVGSPWPQQSPEYLREKVAAGFGRQPLVRTGLLKSQAGGAGGRIKITKRSVTVGFRSRYADTLVDKGYKFVGFSEPMMVETNIVVGQHTDALVAKAQRKLDRMGSGGR